jgi:spore coat polysaccharide biosynthesis protein SpsF
VDQIVVATTVNNTDDAIVDLAQRLGIDSFRGSEADVLGRVAGALRSGGADVCVEITADCPLLDPVIVDEAVAEFILTRADHPYVSNSDPRRSVPAGLDVQVFEASALYQLESETDDPEDREHVSYGFYRPGASERWNPRFITHASTSGGADVVVTLDYHEDYELIRQIHEELSVEDPCYSAAAIIAWVRAHPEAHDPCLRVRGLL